LIELREELIKKIELQHGYYYNPDSEVTITAGATQAIFTAVIALAHIGDEVIVIEPAYDCYEPAIRLAGAQVVRVPLDLENRDIDVDKISEAISPKTRLIMINSPHNPTGVCVSRESMLSLTELLSDTNIILLSDEVYEHIIFDGRAHESVAKHPGLAERSVLISSFGKTYHNTGWKLGYCMAPAEIMNEFRKVHQFNVFCVNRPMQHAFAELLKEESSYDDLSDFYQEKRDFFCEAIRGSRFKFSPTEGTYFQLLDYSELSKEPDIELAKRWTKEKGIASIPISSFYSNAPKNYLLRFCFAKNQDTIEKGAEILNSL
ncbi:MAG: aminotransferase class I/II-fold pyridoxal phosphate-dependent enzyme, partial [Flavobacteriales bacterium]|nr:aminotransferase class I/II-fold pyridoxal phosphate-dependent enzyme [Flavobacteriales bacterium]